jgi:hypothetical protein
MATIGIFTVKLGRLVLSCERDVVHGYVLIGQNFRAPMSLDVAAALGGAAWRIQRRAKKAVDGRMKPGQIFAIQLPDVKVGIGVEDSGLDLYCEVGDENIRLGEEELHALVFALGRLNSDVSSIQQAGESARLVPNFGVVQAMREALDRRLPPWAREWE